MSYLAVSSRVVRYAVTIMAVLIVVMTLLTFIPMIETEPIRERLNISEIDWTTLRRWLYFIDLGALGIGLFAVPKVRINRLMVVFCIFCAMSLIMRPDEVELQSVERLLLFVIMLGLFSPLVYNSALAMERVQLWRALVAFLALDVVASMIYYVPFKIPRPTTLMYPGFIGHPMLLSISAALVTIITVWYIFFRFPAPGTPRRILKITALIIVLLSGVGMTLIPGSRAALLALVCAVILITMFAVKDKRKRKIVGIVVGGVVLVAALGSAYTMRVFIQKFSVASKHGSVSYSRDELWNARWEEFKECPIIGIGFCNATKFSEKFDDKEGGEYKVSEPGSSWLLMLSNVGLLGFAAFVWINVRMVRRLYMVLNHKSYKWRCKPDENGISLAVLYLSLWVALILHGFFEGWVLYAGSLVFMFYWLLTSRILSLPKPVAL